jgi:hypothetical protein
MNAFDSIARSVADLVSHNIVLAGAICLALLFLLWLRRRFVVAIKDKTTYIIVTMNGFSRTLTSPVFLWNPLEWVLKGKKNAPDWSFTSFDEEENKPIEKSLLDLKTGKVDLRLQQPKFRFHASSKNQHTVSGFVDVQFRLEQDLIKHTLKVADFGRVLTNRVLGALREELGEYEDKAIRSNLKTIQTDALKKLKQDVTVRKEHDPDTSDGHSAGQLGVIFYDLNCYIEEAGSAESAAKQGEPDNPAAFTAMHFKAEKLSLIRNDFLGNQPPVGEALQLANNAVLKILEMHTRQQIANSIGQSGQLVILSTDDLGMSGNALLREKMRAMVSSMAASKSEAGADAATEAKQTPPQKPN